jgi:Holliday junction DNA helicase RuvA
MYDYITGEIVELSPTEMIIECNNIGYKALISLQTFSALKKGETHKIFIYQHIREDSNQLYGFINKEEREIFLQLIDVSGIGPNTGRMMLSSLSTQEIKVAILNGDVAKIKGVKGIGLKTAQRVIIDLKDKIGKKGDGDSYSSIPGVTGNPHKEEAITALILLGFTKASVEKIVSSTLTQYPDISLEELIKQSLKRL